MEICSGPDQLTADIVQGLAAIAELVLVAAVLPALPPPDLGKRAPGGLQRAAVRPLLHHRHRARGAEGREEREGGDDGQDAHLVSEGLAGAADVVSRR